MFRFSRTIRFGTPAALSSFPLSPLSLRSVPAVYAIGLNFNSHAREVGLDSSTSNPKHPVVIMKGPHSVVTPGGGSHNDDMQQRVEIKIPKFLQGKPEVDYEGELAVIIGKRGKNISPNDAYQHVGGITCAVDVTARRWQGKKGGGQWSFSKSFDTFCPLGPTLAEVGDLNAIKQLTLTTKLNGSVVQEAKLSDMTVDVPNLIAFLSQGTTLEVGTVILCGTPAGVGYRRNPPYFLRDGDTVDVTITNVGTLRTVIRNDVE
jgi:2-keto-4-pentenoate hydratase/2-oxohepta-3-ene-1,7-dioic acid hydratase in catechol pathway